MKHLLHPARRFHELVGNVRQNQTQNSGSTKFESVDAQFCSSDSFAAACAIATVLKIDITASST